MKAEDPVLDTAAELEPLSVFDSIDVARLQPGDVILFRTPNLMSGEQRQRIVALLEQLFPDHESLILEAGQDIAVLRPEGGCVARAVNKLFGRH